MLKEINEVKVCKKNLKQKEVISNLQKLYDSREEVLDLLKDYSEMVFDAKKEKMEQDLKY